MQGLECSGQHLFDPNRPVIATAFAGDERFAEQGINADKSRLRVEELAVTWQLHCPAEAVWPPCTSSAGGSRCRAS